MKSTRYLQDNEYRFYLFFFEELRVIRFGVSLSTLALLTGVSEAAEVPAVFLRLRVDADVLTGVEVDADSSSSSLAILDAFAEPGYGMTKHLIPK